ncbi:MAG TPA: sigma-70 family RNA polymerase sigma factor [Acidimicrobiia bacterium]|nr:sigma-70 family RNA polymerase sigma factor [Acidimicrobiia bacterium]
MALRVDDVDLVRDAALVERFQQGDGGAFDELYRRYFARLVRYCERRVGDPTTAEEIAQDAFVKALQALPRFAGERRFYPWMTVIAHRLCVDHHRRAARLDHRAEVDTGAVGAASEPVFEHLDLVQLEQALGRVRERHRTVLELRDYDGLSYDEIARELGVPSTTVHALLHRARLALRREFEALAGSDRLAGIPVLGALAAALQRWRTRAGSAMSTAWGEAATSFAPLAAVAVAGVVAVGLAGAPASEPPPGASMVVESGRPAAADVPPAPEAAEPRPAAPSQQAPIRTPAPAPPGAGSPSPDPVVETGPVEVFLGSEGSGRARDESEEMPVDTGLGPVFAGVDPAQAVSEITAFVANPGENE